MRRNYDFSVWATQGGGLVRAVGSFYIFVEKPDCPGLDVGDTMPQEWGVAPANGLAQEEMKAMESDDMVTDDLVVQEVRQDPAKPPRP